MMLSVFVDLKSFLMYFSIFIYAFSLFIALLIDLQDDVYSGLGPIKYFVLVLRTSVGDNQMESYTSGQNYEILIWIIWLLIVLGGNVVFMNFIIAVVNESYSNCMSKLVAESYKIKVDMIAERESIMTEA